MEKIVAAIDFGTANSGVVWGVNGEGIIQSFQYVNKTRVNGYAKTRTSLLVKKSLMSRIADAGDNFSIYDVDGDDDVDVYYGNDVQTVGRPNISNCEQNWVFFDYFKMKLHNNSAAEPTIKGSDNVEYKLVHVIGLYLRCLKRATMKAINDNGGSLAAHIGLNDIKWGVTIPTIWGDRAKRTMGDAVRFGLNAKFISILEPEGAAASFATMMSPTHSPQTVGAGMRYMVVDCGGGTTDIVAQEVTKDGGFREICAADGRAAAGWDIDENFYKLLADKIGGVNLTADESYERLINAFRHDATQYIQWVKLEDEWTKLKEEQLSLGHDNEYVYSFELPSGYERWLKRNFPWAVNLFVDSARIDFSQYEIRDRICSPVVNTIIDAARSVAKSCGPLDYVFLAGGLSGLPFLQKAVEEFVTRECRNRDGQASRAVYEAQWAGNHTLCGGTIMRGAAIMLVYERMIQRVSKRNYYYECGLSVPPDSLSKVSVIRRLANEYLAVGLAEREKRDLEASFNRDLRNVSIEDLDITSWNGMKSVLSFVPICVKGKAARVYESVSLSSRDGRSEMTIKFYSSTKNLSFVRSGFTDPDIKSEGSVKIELPKGNTIKIKVDFNEFQQEYFEAKILKDGRVDKIVKIKPEFQIGH